MNDILSQLTTVAWQFAFTTLVLALFSALVVHALFAFSFKALWTRRWMSKWLTGRTDLAISNKLFEKSEGKLEKDFINLVAAGDEQTLYGLSNERICGQVAAGLQNVSRSSKGTEKQILEIFALKKLSNSDEKEIFPSDARDARRKVDRFERSLERGIDQFQLKLEQDWKNIVFASSLITVFVILALLIVTPNVFEANISGLALYAAIMFFAAILSSFFKHLLDRILAD